MLSVSHVLIAAGLLTARALFVLAFPNQRCSWCKGSRRAKKHRHWGRVGLCPKCKGLREHPRLGAGVVHRFAQAAVVRPLMERRKARLKARGQS